MKNLKQVLALGMAFSLTMSTMAGAAFTDSADIKATEAVNMLSALGVIKGYEDGSFKPEGTVTRAEAAKMIFTIRNGGNDDASAWAGTATSFTDLAGYGWAEGYIKYCQSMGIIAGKSATSFDPGAQVTGVELAKMVLVTLGYNAETAGLTGATWANKTLGLAGENGLLDDVSSNLASGLPRQYAAQLLYNGVNADVVTYENGQYQKVETTKTEWVTSPDGKTTQAVQVTTNKTLGNVYMSLETTTVTLNSVSYDSAKNTYTLNTTGGSYTKVTEDYSSLVGQKVNVLHKKGATDSVYGVYADEDVTVVETVAGKLEAVTGKNAIKVDGKEYNTSKAIGDILVYEFNSNVGLVGDTNKQPAESTDKYAYTDAKNLNALIGLDKADAYTVKLIDNNGDSKIDLAVVYPFVVTQVTYAGSTSVTVKNSTYGNKELSEITVYDGIAKDDIVKVTATTNAGDKKYKYEKLEVVTGEVTATRDGGKEGQINGNWYKAADSSVVIDTVKFVAGDKVDIAVVGEYAYNYKISESSATVENLVYVDQAEYKNSGIDTGLTAKIYMTDGTSKVVTISKYDNTTPSSQADEGKIENKVFTYTMDGSKYELKKLSDTKGEENKLGYKGIADVTSGDSAYEKKLLTTNKGKVKIADDAVLFLESKKGEGDVKVVTGKDVNAWGDNAVKLTSGQVAYTESNGFMYAKAGCLVIDSDIPAASGDMGYGYLTEAPSEIKVDNTKYIQFNVWTKDGAKTIRAKEADITDKDNIKKGGFIKYNSGDGTTVTKVEEITTSGAVTAYAGGTEIVVKNENGTTIANFDNKLADDATIVYVDTKNTKGVEGGSIQLASDAEASGYKIANVMYVLSSDNKKIVALFVDTNNDLEKVPNQTTTTVEQGKVDKAIAGIAGTETVELSKTALKSAFTTTTINNLTDTGDYTFSVAVNSASAGKASKAEISANAIKVTPDTTDDNTFADKEEIKIDVTATSKKDGKVTATKTVVITVNEKSADVPTASITDGSSMISGAKIAAKTTGKVKAGSTVEYVITIPNQTTATGAAKITVSAGASFNAVTDSEVSISGDTTNVTKASDSNGTVNVAATQTTTETTITYTLTVADTALDAGTTLTAPTFTVANQ